MWQEGKQDYSRPRPSVGRTNDACILPHVLRQGGDVFLDAEQLAFGNAECSIAGELAQDGREAIKQCERVTARVGEYRTSSQYSRSLARSLSWVYGGEDVKWNASIRATA